MRRVALAIVALVAIAGGCSSSDDVANFGAANAEMAIDPSPSIDDALEWGECVRMPGRRLRAGAGRTQARRAQ